MAINSRNTNDCPCNGCTERIPPTKESNGCHVTCKKYFIWQQKGIKARSDERKQKHEDAAADVIRCRQLRKIRKRLRKSEKR